MAITDDSIHPLERRGTAQRERLLKTLIPGELVLDDRNMADLLAFSGEYARQIRFWNSGDQPEGDWTCFWSADATPLLAKIAATDLDQHRVEYRDAELTFIRACKAEKQAEEKTYCEKASAQHLPGLVEWIFKLAVNIAEICHSLPDNHSLKTESRALIREKLGFDGTLNKGTPIEKLIQFHKTAHEILKKRGQADGELIERYQPFFGDSPCAKSWGLTVDDFNCIDFHPELTAGDRDALWQLFLAFFKILSLLINKAQKVFQQALNGRSDHPPHIALFLAFALLFRRYHQTDLNAMADRHLAYYYRDVLRLQDRGAIPDKVHIVFELARNTEAYRLEKGTLLLGGKDPKGIDLLYALTDEMVVNNAVLVEKQSLYFLRYEGKTIPVALPAADRKDGLKIPYEKHKKAWHPLSGKRLFQKLATRQWLLEKAVKGQEKTLIEALANAENLEKIVANPGLMISTPELWLGEGGVRAIRIEIEGWNNPELLAHCYTEISTADGILRLENEQSGSMRLSGKKRASIFRVVEGKPLEWQIGLLATDAAITPLPEDPDPQRGRQPFIRLRLKDGEDYQKFSEASFRSIRIKTSNNDLRDLTLQLGSTQYQASSEIPLIGSTVRQRLSLYASAPEISLKTFNKAGSSLDLGGLDDIEEGEAGSPKVITFGKKEFLNKGPVDTPSASGDLFYSPVSKYSFLKKEVVIPASNSEKKPITIYKIPGESISLNYDSDGVEMFPGSAGLYHVDFLGGYAPARTGTFLPGRAMPESDPVITVDSRWGQGITVTKPRVDTDGNLRLGFENLLPGQTISMLFHFTDGTGNPDHIAPDEIVWSYLRSNEWIRIPAQFMLMDETLGLRQTGIIRIQIPSDINNGNTVAIGPQNRTDLYWLMASAAEDPGQNIFVDALPTLADIYVQAATAEFRNDSGNDLIHLEKGLPEESITQLRFRDPAIATVKQPFTSFGGRYAETGDVQSYYRRIHERLRHRQRAVNVWDYERIVLEEFTKIAIAKCLPHTRDTDVRRPGYVTLAVIPFPGSLTADRIYYPTFNAGELETFENHLNRHNSFFVSGQGGGVVCCCEGDGCGCHGDGSLLVRNAIFEPVRLSVCVRFGRGRDIAWYKKQLNEDLKTFLAPWAADPGQPVSFGARVDAVELLRFLENLDYVDVVMDLKFKHFPNRQISEVAEASIGFEETDVIVPFTSRSVLTTYVDMLNEDNPNVTDHDIRVVEDEACCAGCN
ncbi:hypothetical protein LZD49_27925 [Dyadobacter sp. CY261]|uniref:hypothetical protein n=1 Tax=Dyadobacter sp. CY261 TaxID=2907203 RepID=UPI001F34AFD9|nr:hypothetical protein [Dyadobacter sp. CY261]MCF0074344.1 hypothetical protein [Dyadobacter sp. CY261]